MKVVSRVRPMAKQQVTVTMQLWANDVLSIVVSFTT